MGFEYEIGTIKTQKQGWSLWGERWGPHAKGEVILPRNGYSITADIDAHGGSQVEFILHEVDENDANARLALLAAAANVVQDVQALTANPGGWVRGNAIGRVGVRSVRFDSAGSYAQTTGQLQMTGGVRLDKLAPITSGRALGRERQSWFDNPVDRGAGRTQDFYREYVRNYASANLAGARKQPLWDAAHRAVQQQFAAMHLSAGHSNMLAGILAMMAQIPLNARRTLPAADQGYLQARTDYSKIMLMAVQAIGQPIPPNTFVAALVGTIRAFSPHVHEGHQVFPVTYQVGALRLTGLTIGEWARSMLPTQGTLWGWWQGTDKVTKAKFPGSNAQKDALRSYGGMGSKTDPGDRIILEWRNLNMNHPAELVMIVRGLMDYLRRANR